MGNPTGELRARLDERGISWWTDKYYRDTNTCWRVGDFEWRASEEKDGKLLIGCTCVKYLTPEQAVTATVGAGTLTAEQVRECLKGVYFEGYSDGATHRVNGIEETDWQAIADKLNAVAGTGTCRNISKVTDARKRKVRFVCSECDAWIDSEFIWNHEYSNGESPWVKDCKLNYCPNCGRRIEEEAE